MLPFFKKKNQSSKRKCKFSLGIAVSPWMVYKNLCFYSGILVIRHFMPWFSMTHFYLALYSDGHTLVWLSFVDFGFCFLWLAFDLPFSCLGFSLTFGCLIGHWYFFGIRKNYLFWMNIIIKYFLFVGLRMFFLVISFTRSEIFSKKMLLLNISSLFVQGKSKLLRKNTVRELFYFISLGKFFLFVGLRNFFLSKGKVIYSRGMVLQNVFSLST